MTLQQRQHEFAIALAHLIIWIDAKGLELSIGEVYRPDWVAKYYAATGQGIEHSLHTEKLAADIQIFNRGAFLTALEDLKEVGEYWENMSHDSLVFKWGGFFKTPDTVHFSLSSNGRA